MPVSCRLVRRLLVVLAVGLVAGCGQDDPQGEAARAPSFEGVPWALSSGLDTPGWERAAPSATFIDGRVAGSTGCNRYTAPYTMDGEAMTIGELATTEMACERLRETVQRDYVAALARVAGWRVTGDELVLSDGDGAELLRFSEPSPTGDWEATAFLQSDAVASPIVGTEITASFSADGTLAGSAGCNPYTTTFTSERGAIEIVAPASGRKACAEPAGVMEQEQAYLSALPLAAAYRVEGEMLSLLAADGTIVATYVRTR
jgi:heat shock protein HslJ